MEDGEFVNHRYPITVDKTCPRCHGRFRRPCANAAEAEVVLYSGICDACYEAQERARDWVDEGGEA